MFDRVGRRIEPCGIPTLAVILIFFSSTVLCFLLINANYTGQMFVYVSILQFPNYMSMNSCADGIFNMLNDKYTPLFLT